MKRKITAVLLCLTLLVTLSVNVSAEDLNIATDLNSQITDSEIEIEPIVQDNSISTMAATSGIKSGAVYRIKNVGSGKYMNVHYGTDANGANIYQWTADGSIEQKFRVVYFADSDSYMIYAMCSSDGSNRVVDVTRGSAPLTHGQNIKLYNPTDPTSQQFNIVLIGQGQYRISMKANPNLYLAAYGNSNGSAGGTSATSAGNIYLSNYVGELYQHWGFELVENPPDPIGHFELVNSSKISGWAYQTGQPDTPIDVHVYIKNNSTGSQTAFPLTANQYRADLYAAGYGNGKHAFSYDMNWCSYPSGTYTVSVYGIHAYGGTNPHLGNSPKTFTVRKAGGALDSLSSTGVSGWAWKPDAVNSSIQVHLYVRTLDGETVLAKPTIANIYRPDVAAAGYGTGYYGYSIPIDWSTLPKEELRVTLYAVDGSNENPAFYDGYYNNAPPHGSITLYGIKFEGEQSRSVYYTDAVRTAISNIGVTATNGIFTGVTASTALNRMKNSMIWVIHTHGAKDYLTLNHSTEGISYLEYNQIAALSDGALSGERCVIYGSCSAGEGGEGAENMVNITHQKGAMTVIGWTTEVSTSQVDTWLEQFLVSCGEGKTIAQAKNDAIAAVFVDHNGDYGGLEDGHTYIKGSLTQKLVS